MPPPRRTRRTGAPVGLAALLWLLGPGGAGALPLVAPLPPERPDRAAPQEPGPQEPAPQDPVPQAAPEPVAAPPAEGAAPAGDPAPGIPLPPPRPPELGGAPVEAAQPVPPPAAPSPDDAACLAELKTLGAVIETIPPIANGACGAARPLRVVRLAPEVEASPPATLTCPMALALARWTKDTLAPEAAAIVGQPLKAVSIGTSYECRTQNHRAGAKLSEHAFANGVDVGGFAFAGGRTVPATFLDGSKPEGRFLQAARAAACRHFTTVLGPGADASHASHLHLDLRARKRSYRICQ